MSSSGTELAMYLRIFILESDAIIWNELVTTVASTGNGDYELHKACSSRQASKKSVLDQPFKNK